MAAREKNNKSVRARKQTNRCARENKTNGCAREWFAVLLVFGLLAFVCVVLHRESKEHCETHLFSTIGTFLDKPVCVSEVGGKSETETIPSIQSGSFVFQRRLVAQ